MRLDKYLVECGYFESRNRAIEAIKSGLVKIDGKPVKPSQKVDTDSDISIEPTKLYVSRAAKKLESFLHDSPVEIEGKRALDIGSSTGGFAQILLENRAGSLDCVDVGRDQLHHSLREHPALKLHEETDIRDFTTSKSYDLITCDVSFISILHIIDTIDLLASEGCDIIILYKPQFEVGRSVKRDSRGVVVDSEAILAKRKEFEIYTKKLGWKLVHIAASALSGKDGNQEYLYHFNKDSR